MARPESMIKEYPAGQMSGFGNVMKNDPLTPSPWAKKYGIIIMKGGAEHE